MWQQSGGTDQLSVWHFIRGLSTIDRCQSHCVIDQLDRDLAAVPPALCVRQWIRHCLLTHNLSMQIQSLVSCRQYLLQHYLGTEAFM